MQIKKKVEIKIPLQAGDAVSGTAWAEAESALKKEGYREIVATPDSLVAVRGSHFWSLFNAGDPRRLYHRIECDKEGIRYTVDNWFGVFTVADVQVFECEGDYLRTIGSSDGALEKMQQAVSRANREGMRFVRVMCIVILVLVVLAAFLLLRRRPARIHHSFGSHGNVSIDAAGNKPSL